MKKSTSSLFVVVGLLAATGCGGSSGITETIVTEAADDNSAETSTTVETTSTEPAEETTSADGSSSSGSEAGDIETWLIEVGNDFPQAAKCVADEMDDYAVSDFEKSFDGELNEPFETELDAAYEMCDAKFAITTDG